MKRLFLLVPLLVLGAGFWLISQTADASPDAKIILTDGKSAVVLANACILHVPLSTPTLVRVKCSTTTVTENARVPDAITARVILSAGQRVSISASQCNLTVVVQKPAKVKVTCTAGPTPVPTPAPAATVKVGPNGTISFSPATVDVHVGDTVEWVWDSGPHTVTSGKGTPDNLFCSPNDTNCGTSPTSSTGAKYRHTFNAQGSFQYYCRVHGISMSGTINVNP